MDLDVERIGVDLTPTGGLFAKSRELGDDEPLLVRPDGYVMWRGRLEGDVADTVGRVIRQGLSRT